MLRYWNVIEVSGTTLEACGQPSAPCCKLQKNKRNGEKKKGETKRNKPTTLRVPWGGRLWAAAWVAESARVSPWALGLLSSLLVVLLWLRLGLGLPPSSRWEEGTSGASHRCLLQSFAPGQDSPGQEQAGQQTQSPLHKEKKHLTFAEGKLDR